MTTPIIAFAKDWHEDPTSNHHVLRELAKTRRVLWLNSIATRKPKLSSGRDIGKIVRKVREFVRGPVNVENNLVVDLLVFIDDEVQPSLAVRPLTAGSFETLPGFSLFFESVQPSAGTESW